MPLTVLLSAQQLDDSSSLRDMSSAHKQSTAAASCQHPASHLCVCTHVNEYIHYNTHVCASVTHRPPHGYTYKHTHAAYRQGYIHTHTRTHTSSHYMSDTCKSACILQYQHTLHAMTNMSHMHSIRHMPLLREREYSLLHIV